MAKIKRRDSRPKRISKKRFIIITEGSVTEKEYFRKLASLYKGVSIKAFSQRLQSDPGHVLALAQKKDVDIEEGDQLWLVVDYDNRAENDFKPLQVWVKEKAYRNLAISNPCFELWLLMHYEEARKIHTTSDCINQLKKTWKNYDKYIPHGVCTPTNIQKAIERAEKMEQIASLHILQRTGTTVYRLVKNIIKMNEQPLHK